MPATSAPFGLRPIGLIGGRPYTGAVRQIAISNAYSTAMYTGDVVKLGTDGYIAKDTGTATATPVGVFLGCTYTDPNLRYTVHKPYWAASTAASDGFAYVADDPQLLFAVQGSTATIDNVGNNAALVQGSGSATTGMSGVTIGSYATSNTLPIRIVDIDRTVGNAFGDTYPVLIVKWNFGMHQYDTATGT